MLCEFRQKYHSSNALGLLTCKENKAFKGHAWFSVSKTCTTCFLLCMAEYVFHRFPYEKVSRITLGLVPVTAREDTHYFLSTSKVGVFNVPVSCDWLLHVGNLTVSALFFCPTRSDHCLWIIGPLGFAACCGAHTRVSFRKLKGEGPKKVTTPACRALDRMNHPVGRRSQDRWPLHLSALPKFQLCYMEYNEDLFRHYIRNYWHEGGTKFDDCGTTFVEISPKYNPEVIKYRPYVSKYTPRRRFAPPRGVFGQKGSIVYIWSLRDCIS